MIISCQWPYLVGFIFLFLSFINIEEYNIHMDSTRLQQAE
ncbi:hypothetical protein CHCC20331_1851 [Bacillus paralicheniformis]|uniref:Uncharacterized protein n=1 Tax=Bacillus paralicheniformis TaxID=1648923 RepID=A0A7Z1B3L6_9BACI|nr:hypothetical protein B4121_3134 [Bacillus paralicheniformis]TWK89449.1 hypothetical protein CHCC20331_1851 [Bacillus paralicheniformis]